MMQIGNSQTRNSKKNTLMEKHFASYKQSVGYKLN
jgi:hypothetical protein